MRLFRVFERYQKSIDSGSLKRSSVGATRHQISMLRRYLKDIELNEEGAWRDLRDGVDYFKQARLKEGVTPETVNGALRILSAALNLGRQDMLVPPGPVIRKLPTGFKRVSILDEDEREDVRAAAARVSPTAALALDLALYAGLRHAEIVHLTFADFDKDEAVVRVTPKGDDGYGRAWMPKAYHERAIPISKPLATTFDLYCHQTGLIEVPEHWVFQRSNGKRRMDVLKSPEGGVKAAFDSLGIGRDRKAGLHMGRRTFASRLLAGGADLETVRDLLGHASVETTLRYLGTTPKRKFDAVRIFDDE